ncbi:MAG TPA: alkaline phosphatase D family protein [Candidatus Saccharimonadales bacterium]|nr:alkaline phosphatase D family protein [Candidatus Saccharimonadales bacterium]
MAVVLDFNGGTPGQAIPTGGVIQEVNGAVYTATAMHGGVAMETTGNAQYIRANLTTTVEHSGSLYFRCGTVPSSRMRAMTIASSGNGIVACIGINSSGKIDLFDSSVRATSIVNWTVDTWHRVDWQYVQATKLFTVRIFLTPEATMHDDEISFAFTTNAITPAKWMLGGISSGAGTTLQLDTLSAVSGLSWIGPFGTPVNNPGTVVHHWTGAPTSTGFKVHSKTAAATSVRLVVGTDASVTQNLQSFGPAVPDAQGYVPLTATGLTANTKYYYQLEDTPSGGSATRIGPIGSSRTLVSGRTTYTFDFGNCTTNANQGMEAYDEILADDPLFFFHLGDFHYENSLSTDPADHRFNLENQINSISGLRTLIQNVPTYYMRSDHDGGGTDNSDAGGYYAANQTAAKQVAPFPALANQPTDALYFSWVVGRIRFIALDIRNAYRSPGADAQTAGKTMLGATQKQWLKDRLLDAEPVKIILTDSPWIGAASLADGLDKWWAYDNERTEIGTFITTNSVRALMISGDLHSVYADDGTNNQWGSFPIIGAGPLANVGGFRGGPYQQLYTPSGATQSRAFGRCTITDTGSSISLAYTGRDALNNIDRASMTTTWNLPGWFEYNGTDETPLTLEGEYDGSSVDPLTYDQVT